MSTVKNQLIKFKQKLILSASKIKKVVVTRWRILNPGFRYALVYFISVVCVASVVWWQFNPGNGVVFVPDTNPPIVHEPQPDDDLTETPGQVPGDQDYLERPNGFLDRDQTVFVPQRDTLDLPHSGEILLGYGDPFEWSPGIFRGGLDGIHIAGTRGDPIHAAWQGVVEEVFQPEENEPGEVWIKHGEWQTRYRNLVNITVRKGQIVDIRHKIGELSGKFLGLYIGDYLEFELWGPDGPHNPLANVDTSR